MQEQLKMRLQKKVCVCNDANAAALGELWQGGGQGVPRYGDGNAWNRRGRSGHPEWGKCLQAPMESRARSGI